MLNLWLIISVILVVFITYKSITEGFNRWGFMYTFAAITILMYFMRRFMMKRMEKHMKFLDEQAKSNKNQ